MCLWTPSSAPELPPVGQLLPAVHTAHWNKPLGKEDDFGHLTGVGRTARLAVPFGVCELSFLNLSSSSHCFKDQCKGKLLAWNWSPLYTTYKEFWSYRKSPSLQLRALSLTTVRQELEQCVRDIRVCAPIRWPQKKSNWEKVQTSSALVSPENGGSKLESFHASSEECKSVSEFECSLGHWLIFILDGVIILKLQTGRRHTTSITTVHNWTTCWNCCSLL